MDDPLESGLPAEAQPQEGDSAQMVLIRKILRGQYKLAQSTADLQRRLAQVESQTDTCADTAHHIQTLREILAPPTKPQMHIDVRVRALEATQKDHSNSRQMWVSAAVAAVFVALIEAAKAMAR